MLIELFCCHTPHPPSPFTSFRRVMRRNGIIILPSPRNIPKPSNRSLTRVSLNPPNEGMLIVVNEVDLVLEKTGWTAIVVFASASQRAISISYFQRRRYRSSLDFSGGWPTCTRNRTSKNNIVAVCIDMARRDAARRRWSLAKSPIFLHQPRTRTH